MVDGSNLATEGRSTPSLAQLEEAVMAYKGEHPDDEIIVVVDASFGYRIDPSEQKRFEEAEEAGEIASPPAGAIGRGDGFLLRIADRIGAIVLSNDSFQEFHGDYGWLFDEGRLVGGKPVPLAGWVFTPRTPVRGPRSRVAIRDAKAKRRAEAVEAEPVQQAIAEATAEAVAPEGPPSPRRRRRVGKPPEAVNEPLPFITFIAEHPLGSEVEGTVDSFTSHGAFVMVEGARCYAPVSGLGDPPPRSAKEVLTRGDTRRFVVQALDPPRRGIELALPGLAHVSGAPTEETVEAEIEAGTKPRHPRRRRGPAPGDEEPTSTTAVPAASATSVEAASALEEPEPPRKATRARKAARKPAGEPEPATHAGEEGGEAVASVEQAVPAKKATRARKAAKAKAEAEAVPAASATSVDAASALEPAPAKKAARARKAGGARAVPVEEAAAAGAEPPAGEPVKRTTKARKATAKKAVASRKAVALPAEPLAEEAGPAEQAPPARKAARPRKAGGARAVPSDEAVASAGAEPPAGEPAKKAGAAKRATRARKAAAKPAPADPTPALDDASGEEEPPKKARPRKASSLRKAVSKAARVP